MASSFSPMIRLLSLLLLTSNLFLQSSVSAQATNVQPPNCNYITPGSTLQEWQKQDYRQDVINVGQLGGNIYQNGEVAKWTAKVTLMGRYLTIDTNLPSSGRLRLVKLTTKDNQVGLAYIGDVDSCKGNLDGSGLVGDEFKLSKVEILTLQGAQKKKTTT